ncbi:MAG TPA: phage holin family protein, partial [Gaiellaceae bacterium]|nr:phage holin family protein [Gaiellaceae bacterium]
MSTSNHPAAGAGPVWRPARPKFRLPAVILSWILSAAALLVAAWIVPGAHVNNFWSALVAVAVIALLNALLPPLVAALRLPLMLVLGLLIILVLDALMLLAADRITDGDLA